MRLFTNNAKNGVLCIGGIAVAWLVFFKLNFVFFSHFEKSHYINWVFIPAGVRLVSVLLFDEYAIVGLFIGALITSLGMTVSPTEAVVLSLISAFNPYLAIKLTKRILKLHTMLNGLSAKQLVVMSFFAAIFNCLTHNLYFYFINPEQYEWFSCVSMFTGDFAGILIVLYLFALVLKIIRKSVAANVTN